MNGFHYKPLETMYTEQSRKHLNQVCFYSDECEHLYWQQRLWFQNINTINKITIAQNICLTSDLTSCTLFIRTLDWGREQCGFGYINDLPFNGFCYLSLKFQNRVNRVNATAQWHRVPSVIYLKYRVGVCIILKYLPFPVLTQRNRKWTIIVSFITGQFKVILPQSITVVYNLW